MRRLAIILALLVPSSLLYAQPELLLQPIEILDPSLSAVVTLYGQSGACNTEIGAAICYGSFGDPTSMILADGSLLILRQGQVSTCSGFPEFYYSLVRTTAEGVGQEVARFHYQTCLSCPSGSCLQRRDMSIPLQLRLDSVNGYLYLRGNVLVLENGQQIAADGGLVRISGFPKLFDTLLTFIPGGQAMNILTPAHPDGFRSADSLQVWTGNVRSMPDWSQAETLTCEAAANPTPGQVVSVADSLPNPVLGEGRYYLVASQSGTDRRLGRQYVNGAYSARQPAGLSFCD